MLREESHNLQRYIKSYDYILNHEILRTLLNIILKIHNFLNKSLGKKEEKNFDIRNISNIITLKNNNKQFMDILLKIYFDNNNKTINRSDLNIIHNIIESDQMPIKLIDYEKNQRTLDDIKESLTNLSLNKLFQAHINKLYDDLSESFQNIFSDIQCEQTNRYLFLEYFGYPTDCNKSDIINSILSNCYTLLSKLPTKPIVSIPKVISPQPPTQKKNIPTKENNFRASNLINKYNLN
jgi:hypothetical protein